MSDIEDIEPGTRVVINAKGQEASTDRAGKVFALAGSTTRVASKVGWRDYYTLEGLAGYYSPEEFDVVPEEAHHAVDNTAASHAISGSAPTQEDLDRMFAVAAGSITLDDAMAEALKTPPDPEEEFRRLYLNDAAFHAGVESLRARMKYSLDVLLDGGSIDVHEYDRQVELLDRLGELP